MAVVTALQLLSPSAARAEGESASRFQSVVHARPKREDGSTLIVNARELAERGVNNLAEALEILPEVQVREGGRGDTRVDLRGAKQRSLLILIDGAVVDEPYLGSFDLSSIPITDIVEIRVTLSPASPLEGPGGDGGIIEVQTLRATGGKRIDARVRASTTPEGQAAITGRAPLGHGFSVRASAGGRYGAPTYPVTTSTEDQSPAKFVDTTSQEHAGLRLEYQSPRWRLTADGWYQHRAFFVPPSDQTGASLQQILGEDAVRAIVGAETEANGWRVAVGGYGTLVTRSSRFFLDYTLKPPFSREELSADREGGAVHVDKTLGFGELSMRLSLRVSVDTEGAVIRTVDGTGLIGKPGQGRSTFGELAVGVGLKWRWLRLDAAFGEAIPFDNPGAQWQEGKLSLIVTPNRWVQFQATGARKGRVPTLRELYEPAQGSDARLAPGNPKLSPEQSWYADLQVVATPHKLVNARLTGYWRRTEGLIRLQNMTLVDQSQMQTIVFARQANLDDIDVRGIEASVDVARGRILGGGAAYIYADPTQLSDGNGRLASAFLNPIDNFPKHRFEAWISSTFRREAGVQLRVRYVGERFDKVVLLHSYVLGELTGWVKIRKWLRMNVRVDNLFAQQYELHAGLQALPTTLSVAFEGTWE